MGAPTTRVCRICKGDPQPLADFYVDRRDALGHQKTCKKCQKARGKKYAENHQDYFKRKGREKYDPKQNKARYQTYRDDYLQRRDERRRTVRGRLLELLSTSKKRAVLKGLPFTLTLDWALEAFENQGGCCLLTGIPFTFDRNPYGERFYRPFSPSLDQNQPGGGYTPENTRLVCVAVNIALNRFGEEVFHRVCEGFLRRHQDSRPKRDAVEPEGVAEPDRIEAVVR